MSNKMETVWTDRRINETGCMLYLRILGSDKGVKVFAFKHDEFRCELNIFDEDIQPGELEQWLLRPVNTAASY